MKILVATDGSRGGQAAVEHAAVKASAWRGKPARALRTGRPLSVGSLLERGILDPTKVVRTALRERGLRGERPALD